VISTDCSCLVATHTVVVSSSQAHADYNVLALVVLISRMEVHKEWRIK